MKKQTILLSVLLLVLLMLPPAGVMGQERGPMQLNPGPTLISPADETVFNDPTNVNSEIEFVWNTIEGINWYNLRVVQIINGSEFVHIQPWFNSSACTDYTPGIGEMCRRVSVPGNARNGAHWWSVRGYNETTKAYTAFTNWRSFTIPFTVTGMTMNSPAEHRGDPTFTWSQDTRVQWYQLLVGVPTTPFTTLHNVWYEVGSTDLTCVDLTDDGQDNPTCSVTPLMELVNLPSATYPNNSEYHWYMRAWSQVQGFSPYTSAQSFGLNLTAPDGGQFNSEFFDVFADDNINTIDQPVFVFNDIPGAAWYNLVVFKANNQLIHNGWYRRTTVCEDVEGTVICEAFPTSYSIPEIYLMNSAFKSYGDYKWHVRAWGPGGFGTGGTSVTLGGTSTPGFSPQRTLLVNFPALSSGQSPTQVYPQTLHPPVSNANLRFEWQPLAGGTWYNLYIVNNKGNLVFSGWRHFSEPGVDCLENCHWPNPISLASGRYWWRISAWGPAGISSGWSGWNRFDIN